MKQSSHQTLKTLKYISLLIASLAFSACGDEPSTTEPLSQVDALLNSANLRLILRRSRRTSSRAVRPATRASSRSSTPTLTAPSAMRSSASLRRPSPPAVRKPALP